MSITDRAQKVLAEIDAALALADNAHGDSTPDYTHCQGLSEYYEAATDDSGWPLALRCLKTAIEGYLAIINAQGNHTYMDFAKRTLTAICDQRQSAK